MDYLVRRSDLKTVSAILPAIGRGQRWTEAFRSAFGQTPEQFQAEFFAAIPGFFPISIPAAGPPGTSFTFVLTGFKAGERVTVRLLQPGGTRVTVRGTVTVLEGGVVRTSTDTPAGTKPGTWTVEASGDQGSYATVTFTVLQSAEVPRTR